MLILNLVYSKTEQQTQQKFAHDVFTIITLQLKGSIPTEKSLLKPYSFLISSMVKIYDCTRSKMINTC